MRPALIFMHIPKCGGSTLSSMLKKAIPERRRFRVGEDIRGSRMRLAALPDSERLPIDLLYGHLSYGWHDLLLPRQAWYFTMVREPLARVVSHYNFVRSHEWHYLHSHVVDSRMTVADYVESGITTEVNNGQVRQISGVEDIVQSPYGESLAGYGTDHSSLLTQALENIERHFLMAGILERFEESAELLKRLTGLPIGTYRRKNESRSPGALTALQRNEIDVIRRYNREDCELYRRLMESFEARNREMSRTSARRA